MTPRKKSGIAAELAILLTFFVLILCGTFLLRLPLVQHEDGLTLIDALFTATSAVCVTGLVTVPTSGFNGWGQGVLLLLMQMGAIGIMTLSAGLLLLLQGELDLRQRLLAATANEPFALKNVEGVLRTVVLYTLTVEALGLLVLAAGFAADGFRPADCLYLGLFHTISAFCNAGFSPFDSSLIDAGPVVKLAVMALIVLGGLGYFVVYDLAGFARRRQRLTIHTRLVLLGSGLLFGGGALLLAWCEGGRLPFLDAAFQAVTARTAGFNTVDVATLNASTLLVLMALMVIGAAPGSTGGGVKLTTALAVLLSVYAISRGRASVVVFGRKIGQDLILRAHALLAVYLLFILLGAVSLLQVEGAGFLDSLFETVSALGTVGLSTGLTAKIEAGGKAILMALMLSGRVGPAMLVILFMRRQAAAALEYPEEKIILG